jgi:septum formation protein
VTTPKLILASTSPRRRELLKTLNIPFEVVAPQFEEKPTDLSPDQETLYFAEEKARSVADHCAEGQILASDTLVAMGEKKLGQPKDAEDAVRMLHLLSGKTHQVYTAVVVLNTSTNEIRKHLEKVDVTFRPLTDQEIKDYVATGEPFDKAGAYAIQGGAKDFTLNIVGDLEAVIGLPTQSIQDLLFLDIYTKLHSNV